MSIEALLEEFRNLPADQRRAFRQEIDREFPELATGAPTLGELYGVSDEEAAEIVAEFEAVERGEVELLDGHEVEREIAAQYGFEL